MYTSEDDRASWNLETENYDYELSRQSFPFQPLPQLARPPVVWPWKILLPLGSQLIPGERGQLFLKQKTLTVSFWDSHPPFNPCLDFGGSCKSWYKKRRRMPHQLQQHDNWCLFHLWDHPAAVIFSAFSHPSLTTFLSEFWHNPVQSYQCEKKTLLTLSSTQRHCDPCYWIIQLASISLSKRDTLHTVNQ